LMACLVAKWNACTFCVGAHGAVAAKEMQRPAVDEALADFRTAPISGYLKSALAFLEVMTLRPKDLKAEHAKAALSAGVSPQALIDAIAVGALFNIVTRYADALDFAMPTPEEFERAANMLLKRGYAS
jgi:AhpD family alkylhydroperoxidase